jgi:tetratricopeptide (TPR) repeat protein
MNEHTNPQKSAKAGTSAYQKGKFEEAAQAFHAARRAYEAVGDMLNAGEMANNCSVACLQAGNAAAALQELDGIESVFAQAKDLRRQGMTVGNRAAALEALGRLEEAGEAYFESAGLLQQAGEDQLRVSVMQSLSGLQLRTGKQLQALVTMQQGLDEVKKPSPRQRVLKRLLSVPFEMMTRKR